MSHQVHPKIYRLKGLPNWESRWYFDRKKTPKNLEEDFRIREFLKKKIRKLGVEKIEIEKFGSKINIIIYSARPGLIIGRGGGGIEDLKNQLENKVLKINQKNKREIKIEIREIKDPWSSAALAAQWVVQQIERRIPHRRILKQALEKIMASKGNKGARIEVSGRLNGVEIARREWLKKGRLPRQTIRADIDYAHDEALCTYGIIGIKVWIYKGEKFDEE